MNALRRSANALYEFLFPKPEAVLAIEAMSPGDLVVLLPAPEEEPDAGTIAVFAYAHPLVRDLIWELKYRGNRLVARKLALILHDVLRHELAERALSENFTDPLLVPMPVSDKRRLERGYNQCEILAEALCALDQGGFVYDPLLQKITHTESQARTHATRREREENLRRSMSVPQEAAERVRGRNVIVLDDVTTSGATFAEARRALKEAGARKILCLAVAH
jgi:ComF family protein